MLKIQIDHKLNFHLHIDKIYQPASNQVNAFTRLKNMKEKHLLTVLHIQISIIVFLSECFLVLNSLQNWKPPKKSTSFCIKWLWRYLWSTSQKLRKINHDTHRSTNWETVSAVAPPCKSKINEHIRAKKWHNLGKNRSLKFHLYIKYSSRW